MLANHITHRNSLNPTRRLASDARGLSTVEYIIILVLIASAAVGAWKLLGGTIKSKITDSNTTIHDMEGTSSATTGQGQSASNGQGQSPAPQNATNSGASQPTPPTPGKAAGKVDD